MKYNLIILGSGRSGTSMLTGMLANSGYHFGDNFEYLNKNKANPKGYFEDYEVNTVNEDILRETLITIPEFLRKALLPKSTFYRARWLARVNKEKEIKSNLVIEKKIEELISKPNFCYKDPRFSYTLPIWKRIIDKQNKVVKYLVVYREPERTANSIVRECKENLALHPLKMTLTNALKVWELMYCHILESFKNDNKKEDWLFVHFNQLFILENLEKIEVFLGHSINKDFPEQQLSRAELEPLQLDSEIGTLYEQLNILAKY